MKIQLVSVAALMVIGIASSAWAGAGCCGAATPMADQAVSGGPGSVQTRCPVLGEPIQNKDVYVDYKGYRIYLCCAGCKATFEASPEKYMKKFEADGVQLDKTPAQE
jgi:YHS domain-containing protein